MRRFRRFFSHLHDAIKNLPSLFGNRHFLWPFLICFLVFGFLLNFFAAGSANWQLFQLSNLRGKLVLIAHTVAAVFGVGRTLPDFFFMSLINLVQSVLIGLLFFILHFRKQNLSDNLQSTGIIASFFLLSSGCPTCGTALLAPIFISILGSSGLALIGTVSVILNLISLIMAFFVFQKLGYEAYIISEAEKYQQIKSQKAPEGEKHEQK